MIKYNQDDRGLLTSIILPFEVKNFFILTDIKKDRGHHKNRKTRQYIWIRKGSIDISLNGRLERRYEGFNCIIEPETWRVFSNASEDCEVLVFCSESYMVEDYIRDEY